MENTAEIREEIYNSLEYRGLFPEEQKGWHGWTRRTGDLLYINQHILKESQARKKNAGMASTDYK